MAWVEGESWEMEQGLDALKLFELFSDTAQTIPWSFVGWDVNATVSDEKGRTTYAVTVQTTPAQGQVKLILPEAIVNTLKVGGSYRYDCLMVPPGTTQADDNFLATGPVTVALRSSRRDP
jgi:ligand-binding SRPBCC domain-containing protein